MANTKDVRPKSWKSGFLCGTDMSRAPEISRDPFFLCVSGLSAHAVELLQGLNLKPADADGPPTIDANSLRVVELLLQALAASAGDEIIAASLKRASRALFQLAPGAAAIDDDAALRRMRKFLETKPGHSVREAANRTLAELGVARCARPNIVDRLRRKWRAKKLGQNSFVPPEQVPTSPVQGD